MDNNINLSIAMDILNIKIAKVNMELIEHHTEELQKRLDQYLVMKEKLYKGDKVVIEQIINNEI